MSFVGVKASVFNAEAKKAFTKLAIYSEPSGTVCWSIMGDKQPLVRGKGRLRHEGNYLLTRIAKYCEGTELYASSVSPRELGPWKVYYVRSTFGIAVSSSKDALERVFPGIPVAVL